MSGSWRLRVERGPNAGQSFAIDQAETTIGRQENNTVMLDDARLSRQHARIDRASDGLSVTDLNSANGTLVNGRPVTGTTPLNPGDRVQLGDTILVIENEAAPPTSASAAIMLAEAQRAEMTAQGLPSGVPRLIVQGSGQVFRLDRPSLVIGRQPDTDLPLEDTQASRQHARFETRNGQVTLTDLNSANGTKVNGVRVSAPTPLKTGDAIQIGTSQLRVEGIAFADHGTAAALGFYPPPPSVQALNAAPPPGAPPGTPFPPALPALGVPQIEGATLPGSAPPPGALSPLGAPPSEGATMFGSAPPPGALPPLGTPPSMAGSPPSPPGPPGAPWNAPPPPQFGVAPPPIRPPSPPLAAQRTRSPLPLILGLMAALFLLVCVGGGLGVYAVSRRSTNDTVATPGTSTATAIPVAVATPMPAAGSSGGNVAPPPPGASPAPSSGASVPVAAPLPSSAPSTAALAPTAGPARTTTPTARASTVPASGNRQIVSIPTVGLQLSIPGTWRQSKNNAGERTFISPDNQAQIIIRWSTQVASGLTARQVILNELTDTETTDSSFDAATVRTGAVPLGGQQGYGTDTYSFFSPQNGARYSEADRAVVLPGRAQYFFGFVAIETAFNNYAATFDEIIATLQITGP